MTIRKSSSWKSVLITVASVLIAVIFGTPSGAAEQSPCPATDYVGLDRFFADEVWPKVGEAECLKCHKQGGDAEDTRFVLQDLSRSPESERAETMRLNRDAFVRMALQKADDRPLLLVKVIGGLDHGGQEVLKKDSTGYRILGGLCSTRDGPTFRSRWQSRMPTEATTSFFRRRGDAR